MYKTANLCSFCLLYCLTGFSARKGIKSADFLTDTIEAKHQIKPPPLTTQTHSCGKLRTKTEIAAQSRNTSVSFSCTYLKGQIFNWLFCHRHYFHKAISALLTLSSHQLKRRAGQNLLPQAACSASDAEIFKMITTTPAVKSVPG